LPQKNGGSGLADAAASCCAASFTASTNVLLADGTTKGSLDLVLERTA